MININKPVLVELITSAAEMGANNALRSAGLDKSQVSKAEAYRRYSRKRVDRWISDGLVFTVSFGSSILINVKDLEIASLKTIIDSVK